jgi:TM2 domain-containing membrane protein YozV
VGEAGHSPIIAIVFSSLLRGLGQFYNHENKKAVIFFMNFLGLSHFFSPAGFFITIGAIIDAYKQSKMLKKNGFISKTFNLSIIVLTTDLLLPLRSVFLQAHWLSYWV